MNHTEIIVNFTRKIWNDTFSTNTVPPLTLIYDPKSSFTEMLAGFFHIAHDYYGMEQEKDPDDYIYFINPDAGFKGHIESTDQAPNIECLLLCSYKNDNEIEKLLSKVVHNGLIIVLNNIITFQKNVTLIDTNIIVPKEVPHNILWDIKAYKVKN